MLTINRPDVTAIALVYLIAAWAIATGVSEAVASYQFRQVLSNEWLLAISGVVSVIFGAFLIVAPGDGVYAVLWAIGYNVLFAGVMYAAGLRLRGLHEKLQPLDNVPLGQPAQGDEPELYWSLPSGRSRQAGADADGPIAAGSGLTPAAESAVDR